MSELYVKWNDLSRSSKTLSACANTVRSCAGEVESVRSRLRMSDEVAASIKSGLSKEISKLYELAEAAKEYSRILQDASQLYRTTEENNIQR